MRAITVGVDTRAPHFYSVAAADSYRAATARALRLGPAWTYALPPTDTSRSAYLSAILDACGHPTSPPTLKQLLSHPYFAPVDGFEREDVRAAYRRWRSKGLV